MDSKYLSIEDTGFWDMRFSLRSSGTFLPDYMVLHARR